MQPGIDYPGVTVVYFCHDGQGNYLFNLRSKNCRDEHGCWDPGGGRVEFGSTVTATLKKEIREEYCTNIIKSEFLGFSDIRRTHSKQKTHWLALFFKIRVDRSKVKNGEPHKFEKIDWFRLDKIPKPQHSQLPKVIKKLKNQLTS